MREPIGDAVIALIAFPVEIELTRENAPEEDPDCS
jgi:hypothetical protein